VSPEALVVDQTTTKDEVIDEEELTDLVEPVGKSRAAISVGKTTTRSGLQVKVSANQIQEARIKGYEGTSCPECSSMTLVRNGSCLKCETCGATTGCS
jgi:ribonucleoside-diphosphate reductase alpha chain